jgi:hypothetical protein
MPVRAHNKQSHKTHCDPYRCNNSAENFSKFKYVGTTLKIEMMFMTKLREEYILETLLMI